MLIKWFNHAYNTERFGLPSWRRIIEVVADPAGGDNPAIAADIAARHPTTRDKRTTAGYAIYSVEELAVL